MATKAALCPTSLEEQVQQRIAAAQQSQGAAIEQQEQPQSEQPVAFGLEGRAQSEPADMGSSEITVEPVHQIDRADETEQLASTSKQAEIEVEDEESDVSHRKDGDRGDGAKASCSFGRRLQLDFNV
ncbi:unnamed protein product [Toxocara canis]|uniref:Uncharacterized protein n=1 Tax=Toxocara canis TaxID=6265 RepID=A0A183VCH2_TOXCA|nr:unnamed protein product [Toxocara canis]